MSAKPEPLASLPEEFSQVGKLMEQVMGFVPNSLLTLARRPALARSVMPMLAYLGGKDCLIERELRPLVSYIASYGAGCRYCQAHAIRAAERYGAEQEQLDNIWEYKTHPAFTDAERAALDFSLAASMVPNAVDDTIKTELYKYWNEGEIVEMLGVISLFGYLNRWNDSMGTSIEDGAVESGNQYLGKHGWEKGKHI